MDVDNGTTLGFEFQTRKSRRVLDEIDNGQAGKDATREQPGLGLRLVPTPGMRRLRPLQGNATQMYEVERGAEIAATNNLDHGIARREVGSGRISGLVKEPKSPD